MPFFLCLIVIQYCESAVCDVNTFFCVLFLCDEMEEGELRNWMEKLQGRLQASTVDTPQQLQAVLESVVMKKQSLCETLQSWNSK